MASSHYQLPHHHHTITGSSMDVATTSHNPSAHSTSVTSSTVDHLQKPEKLQKRRTPRTSAPTVSDDSKKKKQSKRGREREPDDTPTGYVHVRARRGQATDSHSLAERVRRERISERMKLLQGLVPGCEKVTGKALMLDEIINYVQSLQHQVEFLSMRLASLSPIVYDFGLDESMYLVQSQLQETDSTVAAVVGKCHIQSPGEEAGYPIMDTNAPVLLLHGQQPFTHSQENGCGFTKQITEQSVRFAASFA